MELIKSQQGYLTILTGKTDMGKSTITVYDCSEQLREGKKVTFFSYEYCQSIIYNKMIDHFKMSWSDLFRLNVVDASTIGLDMLKAVVKDKKDGIDAVYIDYLDLLKAQTFPKDKPTKLTDDEQIKYICSELATLAKECNIAIVLLSQTGASTDFEKTIERLNLFTEGLENTFKMFIGKGSVIDPRIDTEDISHLILVEGYNLKHYSTINIKAIYQQ